MASHCLTSCSICDTQMAVIQEAVWHKLASHQKHRMRRCSRRCSSQSGAFEVQAPLSVHDVSVGLVWRHHFVHNIVVGVGGEEAGRRRAAHGGSAAVVRCSARGSPKRTASLHCPPHAAPPAARAAACPCPGAPAHAAHHCKDADDEAGPVHRAQQPELPPCGPVLADIHRNRVGHGCGPEAACHEGRVERSERCSASPFQRTSCMCLIIPAWVERSTPPPACGQRMRARGCFHGTHPSAPTRPTMALKKGSATATAATATTYRERNTRRKVQREALRAGLSAGGSQPCRRRLCATPPSTKANRGCVYTA